ARFLRLNARKERSEAPELLLLPVGERMVVALGAFDAHAEEDARGAGGEILRLVFLGRVERQRARPVVHREPGQRTVVADRMRQEIARQAVVTSAARQLLAQPILEVALLQSHQEAVARFGNEKRSKNAREMGAVTRARQELIDQLRAAIVLFV